MKGVRVGFLSRDERSVKKSTRLMGSSMAEFNVGSLLLQAVGGLAVTGGLLFAMVVWLRRLQERTGSAAAKIRLVGQLALSARDRLQVVEVAGEHLLIGVGGTQGPTLLRVLPAPEATDPGSAPVPAESFAQRLGDAMRLRQREVQ